METCNNCKKNITDSVYKYICYVHKDRPYGGYSKNEYPRYLCSQKCLDKYEKTSRCNLCHIIIYEDSLVIQGNDEYLYCDDINTCYNQKFNNQL